MRVNCREQIANPAEPVNGQDERRKMCIRDRGERKRRARMKISEQKRLSGQVSEAKADICPPEIEIKKEIDIEIEKEKMCIRDRLEGLSYEPATSL